MELGWCVPPGDGSDAKLGVNVPVISFPISDKISSLLNRLNPGGIPPVRLLSSRISHFNVVIFAISEGMELPMLVSNKTKYSKSVSNPSSLGKLPEKLFPDMSKTSRSESCPMFVEIVPVKLLWLTTKRNKDWESKYIERNPPTTFFRTVKVLQRGHFEQWKRKRTFQEVLKYLQFRKFVVVWWKLVKSTRQEVALQIQILQVSELHQQILRYWTCNATIGQHEILQFSQVSKCVRDGWLHWWRMNELKKL